MATVTAFIRTSKKHSEQTNVRFRLSAGRQTQLFHVSEILVNPNLWDAKRQEIKAKVLCNAKVRSTLLANVTERKRIILELYDALKDKNTATSVWLEQAINMRLHPEKRATDNQTFFEAFDEFLLKHNVSEVRKSNFRVVVRALKRFELFKQTNLTYANFTADTLREFDDFLRREPEHHQKHPEIYAAVPETRTPAPRGQNTISGMLGKLRTFILWSVHNDKTTLNPFTHFKIEEAIYGTPYYITIEERNKLHKTNLSRHPHLAIQRDIFVFQCLIGCRVGDLIKMKRSSVINGAVEYIPRKTKEGRPVTVRVPLNETAKAILAKYNDPDKLLPFISEQKYNDAIKVIFRAARLNRMVTVINPTTRQEEKRRLCEIASSHLARRTFVGNLYKKVRDPNLVGALSGHKEGSKAFARYREIDDEIKTELVNMLE